MELILEPLSLGFFVRALVASALVGVVCAVAAVMRPPRSFSRREAPANQAAVPRGCSTPGR